MITQSGGFTDVMGGGTHQLTSRQLYPGYPIATTMERIVTPDDLHMSGMAGLPSNWLESLVAIGVILGLLYWVSKGDRG
jgi:hypothetical protein